MEPVSAVNAIVALFGMFAVPIVINFLVLSRAERKYQK
jgi:hypothetical protein